MESLSHFLIHEELIWDGQRNQELGSVCFTLQIRQASYEPKKDVLHGFLFSVDDISLEGRIEVCRVAQHFEEPAYPFLSLILSFLLDVNRQVLLVQVSKYSVHQL